MTEQGTLFGNSPKAEKVSLCRSCGRYDVVTTRTADPYEDDLVCRSCGKQGTASHSREFGLRWQEEQAKA